MKAMFRPLMPLSILPLLLALGLMSVADDAIGLGVGNVNGNPGTGGTLRTACDPASAGEDCAETAEDAQAAAAADDASADAPTNEEAASEDESAENPAAEAEESSVDSGEDTSENVADDSSDDSTDDSGTE